MKSSPDFQMHLPPDEREANAQFQEEFLDVLRQPLLLLRRSRASAESVRKSNV